MIYINGESVAPVGNVIIGHDYSTTEKRIGTWIDGKPLYEITVEWGENIPSNSTRWKSLSLLQTVDTVVMVRGMAYNDYFHQWYPLPNVHASISDFNDGVQVLLGNQAASANDYTIRINTGKASNNTLKNVCVILQYTKTTDNGGNS